LCVRGDKGAKINISSLNQNNINNTIGSSGPWTLRGIWR